MMQHLTRNEIPQFLLNVFPAVKTRKYRVVVRESYTPYNYWDGGSRAYFVVVNLETQEQVHGLSEITNNPFSTPAHTTFPILPNMCVVEHSIVCGKDYGLTFNIHPSNELKFLPNAENAEEEPLTQHESIVLVFTKGLKSSYGGDPHFRFNKAHRRYAITQEQWNTAKESLIAKKLLDRRGALTTSGRNKAMTITGISTY